MPRRPHPEDCELVTCPACRFSPVRTTDGQEEMTAGNWMKTCPRCGRKLCRECYRFDESGPGPVAPACGECLARGTLTNGDTDNATAIQREPFIVADFARIQLTDDTISGAELTGILFGKPSSD